MQPGHWGLLVDASLLHLLTTTRDHHRLGLGRYLMLLWGRTCRMLQHMRRTRDDKGPTSRATVKFNGQLENPWIGRFGGTKTCIEVARVKDQQNSQAAEVPVSRLWAGLDCNQHKSKPAKHQPPAPLPPPPPPPENNGLGKEAQPGPRPHHGRLRLPGPPPRARAPPRLDHHRRLRRRPALRPQPPPGRRRRALPRGRHHRPRARRRPPRRDPPGRRHPHRLAARPGRRRRLRRALPPRQRRRHPEHRRRLPQGRRPRPRLHELRQRRQRQRPRPRQRRRALARAAGQGPDRVLLRDQGESRREARGRRAVLPPAYLAPPPSRNPLCRFVRCTMR